MQVKDIMSRNVECVRPDTTLQDAAERMKRFDVGALPVCDNDRLTGMITDRDITVRAVAEGLDPNSTYVREILTPGTIFCSEDDDVSEVVRLMTEKQVRRILVLSRDKRLSGIVSVGDLSERVSEPAPASHW